MKFLDKNIKRKTEIVSNTLHYVKNSKIPLPSLVEISDSGTCNRSCIFCPRSDPDWISKFDKKEFIKTELHEKICKELSEHNYKGIIVYSGFNDSIGFYGAITKQQKEMAEKWLIQFDLFKIAESSFLNLSYGQQRLFLLARAMVKSPELLLLDEPCQGLDPYQRAELIRKIDLLGKSQVTQILYISHQVEDKLDCISSTIFLPDGRVERNLSAS